MLLALEAIRGNESSAGERTEVLTDSAVLLEDVRHGALASAANPLTRGIAIFGLVTLPAYITGSGTSNAERDVND